MAGYELRKKFREKKKMELEKICHICSKELVKEDIVYMIDNKKVHPDCFRKKMKK